MNTQKLCQDCGAKLSADAPGGLCPACMMKVAMGTGTADDAAGPNPHPFTPPTVEELQGRFPSLEIIQFVGRGGMGAVYKARQKELDRIVALKILPPDIGHDPAFAERFTREARAMAMLNHPGIVTIHEFGRANGLFFFVMEFVDGITLRHLLQRGRIAPREALAIVPAICDALQYAHDQGIVHRDIKPENILIDRRGRVKVADFGLAKLIASGTEDSAAQTSSGASDLTGAGKVMGTPNYIAPEQISRPQDVDHRADIYSLGVVFYQMLTGELPGKGLEPPSKKVHIDVRLDEVVLRALEKDPELRYQQASALKTQVETISMAGGEGSPASPGTAKSGVSATRSTAPYTAASIQSLFLALTISWWIGFPLSVAGDFFPPAHIVAIPTLIVAAVFGCILLYRHWSLLQGHGARTTPGKAVGFSFIPFFFFYWWFVAYAGLATDNNRRLRELSITHVRMSRGIAIAYCVLAILVCTIGVIPLIGAIVTIPLAITGYIFVIQQRNCILALLDSESTQHMPTPTPTNAGQGNAVPSTPNAAAPTVAAPAAAGISWAAVVGVCCFLLTVILAVVLLPIGFRVPSINDGSSPLWKAAIAAAPGLLLVIGTIVFGAIGVAQTRRAPESYYGFGLAFFDLFLFPFLLLNLALAILFGKNTDLPDAYMLLLVLAVDIVLAVVLWRALRPASSAQAAHPLPFGPAIPIGALVIVAQLAVMGLMSLHHVRNASHEELMHNPRLIREVSSQAVLQAATTDPGLPWAWQELQRRAEQGKLTTAEANLILDTMTSLLHNTSRRAHNGPLNWFAEMAKTLRERNLVSDERIIGCVRAMIGKPSLELPRLRVGADSFHLTCQWPDTWHRTFLGYVMLSEMIAVTLDGMPLKPPPGHRPMFRPYNPQFDADFQLPDQLVPGKHTVKCEIRAGLRPEPDTTGLAPDARSVDWPPPPFPELASLTDYTNVLIGELTVLSENEQAVQLTTEPSLDPSVSQALYVEKAFVRNKGGSKNLDLFLNSTQDLKVSVSFDVTVVLDGQKYDAPAFYVFREKNTTTSGGNQLSLDIGDLNPGVKTMSIILTPNPRAIEHILKVERIWGRQITFSEVPLTRQDISASGPPL